MSKKMPLWLALVLSLILSMSMLLVGCDDHTEGDGTDENPTIEVEQGEATAALVNKFTLPTAKISEGAELVIEGTNPDGEVVEIVGYVATLTKAGEYTFTYKAVKGDKESETVTYKVSFTAPEKPEIIFTGKTETTINQALKVKLSPIEVVSDADENVKVAVKCTAPDGSDVTIVEKGKNRYFDAVQVGDYKFVCSATDCFGTEADKVEFVIHVLDHVLTIDVETEVTLGAKQNMALPKAKVTSSITPDAKLIVTVVGAPEGSNLKDTVINDDLTMTPDVEGVYTLKYEVTDELNHHTEVMVTVTVVLAPANMNVDATKIPENLNEGEEWTVPSFAEINGSVAYEWKGWTTDDFNITVVATYQEAGDHEEVVLEEGTTRTFFAGNIHLEYKAVAKESENVTAEFKTDIVVKGREFEGIGYAGAEALPWRNEEVYNKTYIQMDVYNEYGGIIFENTQIMKDFLNSEDGYLRFLVHNPTNGDIQWNLFMRGPRADISDYETTFITGPHPGSKGYELDIFVNLAPDEYREVILPRAQVNDICITLHFTANKPKISTKLDLLEFEFVKEAAYTPAYDLSKGLPQVTDLSNNAVTSDTVKVEATEGGFKFVNNDDAAYRIDLSDKNMDNSVVNRLFNVTKRGINAPVLLFDITNSGKEKVSYTIKMVGPDGMECSLEPFYAQQFTPNLDDEDSSGWTIIKEESPMLSAGKTRTIAISATLLKQTAGDFSVQLDMMKGEITLSNFRFIDTGAITGIPVQFKASENLNLEVGETANVNAMLIGSDKKVVYSPSVDGIVEVDEYGNVKGLNGGECDILITLEGEPDREPLVCHVKVLAKFNDLDPNAADDSDGIRTFDLSKVEKIAGDLNYNAAENRLIYNAGGNTYSSGGFTVGGTINDGEYLVILFKYFEDMETSGYFASNSYQNEGLWIQGYPEGRGYEYFAIFDATEYKDYTIYKNNAGEYFGGEGDPYGSFHGGQNAKGITTSPETWYYAVAPVSCNYNPITSCNPYLHIEVAGIYAVTEAKKNEIFVKHNYPTSINVPEKLSLSMADTYDLGNIAEKSSGIPADAKLTFTSSDNTVATVDGNGVITALQEGNCEITVSVTFADGKVMTKTINVNVVPLIDLVAKAKELGIDNGVTAHGINCISKTEQTAADVELINMNDKYMVYSSAGSKNHDSEFKLDFVVPDDQYIVFQFKYDESTKLVDGLWTEAFRENANETVSGYPYDYLAVFDGEGRDYTTYTDDNDKYAYGSHDTSPDTWYFFVSTTPGNYVSFSSYYAPFKFTIANVYTITQEVKDQLFVNTL